LLIPQSVADFLEQNPGFFEQHTDLLTLLHLPHPHGGRPISIAERQLLALREQVRALEEQVAQLVGFGHQNDALGDKVHALACALLATRSDAAGTLESATALLRDQFDVPSVGARVWLDVTSSADGIFEPVPESVRDAISRLPGPCCGSDPAPASRDWLGPSGAASQSFVTLPLTAPGRIVGALLLGSEDPARFDASQGTQHLARIGAVIGCALVASDPRGA